MTGLVAIIMWANVLAQVNWAAELGGGAAGQVCILGNQVAHAQGSETKYLGLRMPLS